MGDLSFFVDILENQPPYKRVDITQQNYIDLSECKTLRIENYCTMCQKERTFYNNNLDDLLQPLRLELLAHEPRPNRVPLTKNAVEKIDSVETYNSAFLVFIFYCAHCNEEHFYAIKIDGTSIYKVGQHPSFSREHTQKLKKYKNLISKYYTELTSAVNLYSQNIGIASFVYLRRILEHLVDTKYFALPESNVETKFIDKLKAVEVDEIVIPKELEEIKEKIYSVLSKGIHEYTEQECLDLFDAVLFVITAILDQELYKKEQADKAVYAKKMIVKKLEK